MKYILIFILVVIPSFASAASDDWTLERDKKGIQVFSKPVENSSLNAVKGVATIKAPLNRLVSILLNPGYRPLWDKLCSESFLYKSLGDSEALVYVHNAMPWPVSDRDMLARVTWSQEQSTSTVFIKSRGTSGLYPEKDGIVRVTELSHDWVLRPNGDGTIEVTTNVHLDPAGPLPSWLINTLSVESPYDALSKLRQHVDDPAIENKNYKFMREPNI
ncbi:MAG: START domain-containing protein [Spongiibacteraceae bacterium]